MTPHPFDQAVALVAAGEHEWTGQTSASYANFIGPYGGITAAQLMAAVMAHPQRIGDPVALTINFAAAVADGEFTVRARPARTNRSTQHWIVEMLQEGQAVTTATVMTAVRRETWSAQEARMPTVSAPLDVERETPFRHVAWLSRYDRRFIRGNIPREWNGQGGEDSITQLWMRDEPTRPLDFLSLTAMSDVFFPRIWLRRATLVPLGTVTMTVYYHCDAAQLAATGTDHVLGQVQGSGFRNGYLDHAGHLWNARGELLVSTHQLMYYKE